VFFFFFHKSKIYSSIFLLFKSIKIFKIFN